VSERALGRLHRRGEGAGIARRGERERVREVVTGHEVGVVERLRARAPEVAHVRAGAEREAQIVTQLPDVRAALTADPEERPPGLGFDRVERVDLPDPELAGDGTLSGRLLVDRPLERVEDGSEVGRHGGVQFEDGDVLLVAFEEGGREPGRRPEEDRQAAGDRRIERARVGRPVDAREVAHPAGHLVSGGAGRLVEIDNAEGEPLRGRALVGRPAHRGVGARRVVPGRAVDRGRSIGRRRSVDRGRAVGLRWFVRSVRWGHRGSPTATSTGVAPSSAAGS
jgi:hypothetical protein